MNVRALSGETLSRVADELRKVNSGEIDAATCGRQIAEILARRDAVLELAPGKAGVPPGARDRSVGAEALARLNVLLPWTSFNSLGGEARLLGSAWSASKRSNPQPVPDRLVARLNDRLPLRELSVLEAGCFEGHHTASLAQFARSVWAFDGRIENVVKTLVRLWALGLEHAATVNLIDIEADPLKAQLARLGRSEPFDLVHHRGVLYHLSRPLEHLADIAAVASGHIYLHTQIAREDQVNATRRSALGEFAVFDYAESEQTHSPFAGMTEKAVWLTRGGLLEALKKIGFGNVQVLAEHEERNGLRIELLASRK